MQARANCQKGLRAPTRLETGLRKREGTWVRGEWNDLLRDIVKRITLYCLVELCCGRGLVILGHSAWFVRRASHSLIAVGGWLSCYAILQTTCARKIYCHATQWVFLFCSARSTIAVGDRKKYERWRDSNGIVVHSMYFIRCVFI